MMPDQCCRRHETVSAFWQTDEPRSALLKQRQPLLFRSLFIPALLIMAIGAFQIATIRAGQGWGDDFAAYILQTKHMATGQGFVPYEFIPNPATMLGGQAYPPLLSVLLLPAYLIFGLNLYPMKIIGIVCVLVALWFINLVFEDWLPLAWRCVLIVLVGICPRLFDMRDAIESEKPFLVFFFLSIYLLQRAYRGAPERPPTLRWSVLVGLSLFAAEATRNTGAALFPVVLTLDLFYFRRLTRFALLSVLIGAMPSGILSILLRTGGGYLAYYNFSAAWLIRSAYLFSKNSEIPLVGRYASMARLLGSFCRLRTVLMGLICATATRARSRGICNLLVSRYRSSIFRPSILAIFCACPADLSRIFPGWHSGHPKKDFERCHCSICHRCSDGRDCTSIRDCVCPNRLGCVP